MLRGGQNWVITDGQFSVDIPKYPHNVRAMVLDGVVSPSLTPVEMTFGQAAGFESSLQAFLTSCAENSPCAFGEGSPESTLKNLLADIKRQPLPAGGGRTLSRGEAEAGIVLALYSEAWWPLLEEGLAAASAGDGGQLLELSDYYFERSDDGTYPNSTDALYAVSCIDGSPLSVDEIKAHAEEAALRYPFFGASMLYSNLYCTFWPAAPKMEPRGVKAKGAPQIMIVGTTGDPATPFEWSQRLAGEPESAFFVKFQGKMHVAVGASSCVDDLYGQYLLYPDAQYSDAECSKDQPDISIKSIRMSPPGLDPPRLIRRW